MAYHTSGAKQVRDTDISSWSWYHSNSYSNTGDVTGSIPFLLHHAWEPHRPGSPIHSSSPHQDTGLHPAFLQLTLKWLWGFFRFITAVKRGISSIARQIKQKQQTYNTPFALKHKVSMSQEFLLCLIIISM